MRALALTRPRRARRRPALTAPADRLRRYSALLAAAGADPDAAATSAGVARRACGWVGASVRPADGVMPYELDGTVNFTMPAPLQAVAYSAEAVVALGLRTSGTPAAAALRAQLEPTIRWLLGLQRPDGSWPHTVSERIARAVSLLAFAYREWGGDPAVAAAVGRFVAFLVRSPSHSAAWDVNRYVCQTGFVGLALTDLVTDWASFPDTGRTRTTA